MENKKSNVWMITTIVLGVLIALFLVLSVVVKVTGTASSKSKNPNPPVSVENPTEIGEEESAMDSVFKYDDVNVKKDVDVEALNQNTETETSSEDVIGDVGDSEGTENLEDSENTELVLDFGQDGDDGI